MIPYAARKALFFLFVGIFIVSAPLVVLYTAGYRFNRGNNTVSQTGTLAITSTPKGATTEVDNQDINDATPAVLQRLSPGTRTVRLTKVGYFPWERKVNVASGSTTYITAPLFLKAEQETLSPGSSRFLQALEEKSIAEPTLPSSLTLTQTAAGIEVSTHSLTGSELLTLLPSETYTVIVVGNNDLFLKNSAGEILNVSLTEARAAKTVTRELSAFAWNENERLFVWTDGFEVHTYTPVSETEELITRQSDTILSLAFAHDGESLVIASAHALLGIDLISYTDGRMQTPLAAFTDPVSLWFSPDGSAVYIKEGENISLLNITP